MGLRVETTLYSNYTLPPFYDSMVAKIITHQPTYEEAFNLMERALYEVTVEGLNTNIELLEALIRHPEVKADKVHAKWLEEVFMPEWLEEAQREAMPDEE